MSCVNAKPMYGHHLKLKALLVLQFICDSVLAVYRTKLYESARDPFMHGENPCEKIVVVQCKLKRKPHSSQNIIDRDAACGSITEVFSVNRNFAILS